MKITKKQFLVFGMSLITLSLLGCTTNMPNNVDGIDDLDTDVSTNSDSLILSQQEKDGLIQMREEEKLARDVYKTLGSKWGNQVFANIAESEQTHTDAIKTLLDKYGIEDPVIDDSVGSFTSPEMKKLYEDLISQGSLSLIDALIVGATVEDLDINDLNKLIKETDKEDIQIVYNSLNNGSRNHINAFVNNIVNNGGKYVPKYISQSEYELIISSQQGNGGNGRGR